MESRSLSRTSPGASEKPMPRTATKPVHPPEVPSPEQPENPLRILVEWGLAETDAWTLGDLIDAVRSSNDLSETWKEALATPSTR